MLRWIVKHESELKAHGGYAAVVVRHKVYIFGGDSGFSRVRTDVNVFNTVTLRWMRLSPVTTGGGERPLEVPSIYFNTAVLIEDVIYIWGGLMRETYALCDMLYAFDVDTHTWFTPAVSGSIPEARRNHSACVLGKVMYVYGGYVHLTRLDNDIYKLDTATMVWALINTRGTPPPASIHHSATTIGTKMFVFGGIAWNYVFINDVRVFDMETNFWLSTPSARLPKACMHHSAFVHDGELYIFGIHNYNQILNDHLWKFNTETFSWTKVEPKGEGPSQRLSLVMNYCMVGDRIIHFGAELNILDLRPSLKTLCKLAAIQYDLERSELTHDIRWELAAMTTNAATDHNGMGL